MLSFTYKHPAANADHLGFIPDFLSNEDPRRAKDQLDTAYAHGGGWNAFEGFNMLDDGSILYPGDPPIPVIAEATLHPDTPYEELVKVYLHAWVAVVQRNGEYEIARMD